MTSNPSDKCVDPECENENPDHTYGDHTPPNVRFLKKVHDIAINVDTETGRFSAKFNQGDGADVYTREKLQDIEAAITKAVYGFTGEVPVTSRPNSPINRYDVDKKDVDTEVKNLHQRALTVITGVRRTERDRYGKGSDVVFTTEAGRDTGMSDYIVPDAVLDAEFAEALRDYRAVQARFHVRFSAIHAKYKTLTAAEIIATLRAQGAKIPKGA